MSYCFDAALFGMQGTAPQARTYWVSPAAATNGRLHAGSYKAAGVGACVQAIRPPSISERQQGTRHEDVADETGERACAP